MKVNTAYPGVNPTNLLEVPFGYIPLDDAVYSNNTGPDDHHNNTHNNHTHNHTSLIDTCDVMPDIAREASGFPANILSCTSSVFPDCNTLECSLEVNAGQQELKASISIVPCSNPPQVVVSIPEGMSGNHSSAIVMHLTSSQMIESVVDGSRIPVYVNINQHASMLTLGVEVCHLLIKNTPISINVTSTFNYEYNYVFRYC